MVVVGMRTEGKGNMFLFLPYYYDFMDFGINVLGSNLLHVLQ